MIPGNDNGGGMTITIDAGDGDMKGLFLTCLLASEDTQPIAAEVFESRVEALVFAQELLRANPRAVIIDKTKGGAR